MPNPFNGTTNGKIELSDTSCGVGVYVSSVTHATDVPHGTGRLELGAHPPPWWWWGGGEAGQRDVGRLLRRNLRAGVRMASAGDVILSVDGAVTESARETIKYMQRGPQRLTFVLAGRSIG